MFKLLALVVALAAVASAATIPREISRGFPWSPTGRIVGGEDTTIEEVPYQISLRAYGSHNCGGTIIDKYWVLTAGHCVGGSLSSYTVTAGSTYRTKGGSSHHVASIVRHEDYGTTNYGVPLNDIALIRVDEPFEFDETRQAIKLYDEDEEAVAGSVSKITGWGSTGGWGLPNVLQTVNVPIVSKSDCNESYSSFGGVPEGQICAAYPAGGKDACQGDSGGPLAIDGRLAGVVSWGNGCALAGYPGVYTEVATYRAWIKAQSGV